MNEKQGNEYAGDTIDCEKYFKNEGNSSEDNEPCIPCYDKDKFEYCMNSPQKSLCYIFNHTEYEPDLRLKPRDGAIKDCEMLFCCFTRLQFEVRPCANFNVRDIMATLDSARKEDHTNRAAFVCVVLSHGDHNYVYAHDGKYNVKEIYKYFHGNMCPSLVGKPKLFFVQACRGKKVDQGVPVVPKESMDGDNSDTFKIPNQADLLIAHSTLIGYKAFRNSKGSKFIVILCECLNEYAKDKDLLQILTIVNQRLALYESNCPSEPSLHGMKQMPCVWFTLTKQLNFLPMINAYDE